MVNRPISQIPRCSCPIIHNVPLRTEVSILNGALWDMRQVYFGICKVCLLCYFQLHYGDVVWALYHLILPSDRLFLQKLIQTSIKASNAENVSLSWCHRIIIVLCGVGLWISDTICPLNVFTISSFVRSHSNVFDLVLWGNLHGKLPFIMCLKIFRIISETVIIIITKLIFCSTVYVPVPKLNFIYLFFF